MDQATKDFITVRVKIARIKSATSIAQNRKKPTIVYWTSTSGYTNKLYIFIPSADARNENTRIRVSGDIDGKQL